MGDHRYSYSVRDVGGRWRWELYRDKAVYASGEDGSSAAARAKAIVAAMEEVEEQPRAPKRL